MGEQSDDASEPAAIPAADAAADGPTTQPADGNDGLAGVQIDRELRFVDVAGSVVTREADWLELLACAPESREYESVLVVNARPSHIHLALVLIGLKPGNPLQIKWEGEKPIAIAPTGDAVSISLLYKDEAGEAHEVPANRWIKNQTTGQLLEGDKWLFAGSAIRKASEAGQPPIYLADVNGSVISLVSFGDDVLARDSTTTNKSDDGAWVANTDAIPPVGTKVTVRLSRPAKADAGEPTTQPAEGAADQGPAHKEPEGKADANPASPAD